MKTNNTLFFILSSILLFASPNNLHTQNAFSTPAGARGIGMGNANLNFRNIHSIFNNPAGIAHIKDLAALAFVENRFNLKELQLTALSVAAPTKSGNIGIIIQHFGFSAYNEQKVGLIYSRLLFEKLALAGQFDFLNNQIAEYGSKQDFTVELGLQYELSEALSVGFHIFNPIGREKQDNFSLPSIFHLGVTYQISEQLTLSSAIEKNIHLSQNFKLGLEYLFLEKIYFRTGINTQPNRLFFGLGYQFSHFQMNMSGSVHQVLGFSSSFGIVFSPEKKKEELGKEVLKLPDF